MTPANILPIGANWVYIRCGAVDCLCVNWYPINGLGKDWQSLQVSVLLLDCQSDRVLTLDWHWRGIVFSFTKGMAFGRPELQWIGNAWVKCHWIVELAVHWRSGIGSALGWHCRSGLAKDWLVWIGSDVFVCEKSYSAETISQSQ